MYSNNNEFFINEESKNEAINFDGDIPKFGSPTKRLCFKEIDKNKSHIRNKNSKKFREFIKGKSARNIINQYNALKKFIITNSTDCFIYYAKSNSKHWSLHEISKDENSFLFDSQILKDNNKGIKRNKDIERKIIKTINKSLFLQTYHEISRKENFRSIINLYQINEDIKENRNKLVPLQNIFKAMESKSYNRSSQKELSQNVDLQMMRIERNYKSLQEFCKSQK